LQNCVNRPARTLDGRDVVIRVLCIGSEGRSQLDILNVIARGTISQLTPNHAVPLFDLFEVEDITFAVFPRVGFSMLDAFNSWPKNSVGDIVDMILQCLEALAYLHNMGIAHRDAFRDNFLVQWFPSSLSANATLPPASRPRVFINDFETTVYFDEDVPPAARTCVGLPLCATFPTPDRYFRNHAPELGSGEPYDPFKLDVWQLGDSLSELRTTIPEIDTVLSEMTDENPVTRISALDAMKRIAAVVNSRTPDSLKFAPTIILRDYVVDASIIGADLTDEERAAMRAGS
ncbi:kinase-like protein, partial [Trametes cingulata]